MALNSAYRGLISVLATASSAQRVKTVIILFSKLFKSLIANLLAAIFLA